VAGLLEGKRLLVTGVLTKSSIAFHVARIAQQEGAQLVLTSYGRAMSITEAVAEQLPQPPPVLRLDVTSPEDFAGLADAVREELGEVDGVVHSIAFAPQNAMGGAFLDTSWKDAATALEVSAYSFKALVTACLPLMSEIRFAHRARVVKEEPIEHCADLARAPSAITVLHLASNVFSH